MDKNKEVIESEEFEKDIKTKKIALTIVIVFFVCSICLTGFLVNKRIDRAKPDNIVNDSITYNSAYKMNDNSLSQFDLYFLKMENSRENKVYSPLSIKYALGMLYQATDGESKGQIDAVLGNYRGNKYQVSNHLMLANALFVRESKSNNVLAGYNTTIKDKYEAEVIDDPFIDASNINNWVSTITYNHINDFISDDEYRSHDYELVNALAIDMEWVNKIQADSRKKAYKVSYPHEDYNQSILSLDTSSMQNIKFDSSKDVSALTIGASANRYNIAKEYSDDEIKRIVTDEFKKYRANNGDVCLTEQQLNNFDEYLNNYVNELKGNYGRLNSSTDFLFADNEDEKIFAKDLKEYNGITLQYVSIMPKNSDLLEYIDKLDAKTLNRKVNNLSDLSIDSFSDGVITQIDGYIPVFNYDYKLNLKQDLKNMGIVDIFDKEKADLSGMLKNIEGSYIESITHKSTIDFSNDGIKAAAVTAAHGAGSASCEFDYFFEAPVKKIDLTFDKPYMYLIRNKNTGEVWFIGTVYNPTK